MRRAAALVLVLCGSLRAQLTTDEPLRLDALHAIFPGMPISRLLPAATGEPLYAIEGRFTNEIEDCASYSINIEEHLDTREASLKLFRWPGEQDGFAALVQYRFLDANPSLACPSIAILRHLVRGDPWRITDEYLFETSHHFSIRSAELRTFLFVESDEGGAGTGRVAMHIFDLSNGKFDEILKTNTWLARETAERYTQTFDAARTQETGGQSFCFTKALEIDEGKRFNPPEITHPCYTSAHR